MIQVEPDRPLANTIVNLQMIWLTKPIETSWHSMYHNELKSVKILVYSFPQRRLNVTSTSPCLRIISRNLRNSFDQPKILTDCKITVKSLWKIFCHCISCQLSMWMSFEKCAHLNCYLDDHQKVVWHSQVLAQVLQCEFTLHRWSNSIQQKYPGIPGRCRA